MIKRKENTKEEYSELFANNLAKTLLLIVKF
jgi:hypothetical protein